MANSPSNSEYEREVLGWARQKIIEGKALLGREKAYREVDRTMDMIDGDQVPITTKALSTISDNRLRKITLEVASALTDVRPIWNYETSNPEYKKQAAILNKLARGWWRGSQADRKLRSSVMFSMAGGSGYLALTWNPDLPGGGDLEMIPYSPKDVFPIGPVYSDSVQDWQGIILRRRTSIQTVKKLYPSKADMIGSSGSQSWFGPEGSKGKLFDIATSVWDIINGRAKDSGNALPDSLDLVTIFTKDDSVNTGDAPKDMGKPGSNWEYTVFPVGSMHPSDGHRVTREEARLYPRGRLIVCTQDGILHDGPNPYWHGMFPLVRVTLDPTPWSLLGSSMIGDLIPIQNALNEALRGADDAVGQWVRRGVIADKRALNQTNIDMIDTRKAGMKVLVNPIPGEAFKIIEGPHLPEFYMALIQYYRMEIDENSGIKDFKAMQGLKQDPNKDSIDKFMDALSPLLRGRSRSLEITLAELAELLKVCFLQYYTAPRRLQILGKDGLSLEDFDYDPGNMIPNAGDPTDRTTREERAQKHHRNFSFNVAPDSFLSVSHVMRKMMIMQLFRANGIDIYTMWEAMDFNNVGHVAAETLPDRMIAARKAGLQPGPTPEMVAAQEQLAIIGPKMQALQMQMQMQQMMMQGAPGALAPQMGPGGPDGPPGGPSGPGGGASAPPGAPPTSGVGPQGGRPPSGGAPPQMVIKSGPEGPRSVISESGR